MFQSFRKKNQFALNCPLKMRRKNVCFWDIWVIFLCYGHITFKPAVGREQNWRNRATVSRWLFVEATVRVLKVSLTDPCADLEGEAGVRNPPPPLRFVRVGVLCRCLMDRRGSPMLFLSFFLARFARQHYTKSACLKNPNHFQVPKSLFPDRYSHDS